MRSEQLTLETAVRYLDGEDQNISLDVYASISDEAALAVSNYEGSLNLRGVLELSDAAAEALAKHQGPYINLNSLKYLSDTGALALSRHAGDVWLDGIEELSDGAGHLALCSKLIKSRQYPSFHEVNLNNLKKLSAKAAEVLATHDYHIWLGSLTCLPHAIAAALAEHEGGDLFLLGITRISDEAAEALAEHQGDVLMSDSIVLTDGPGHLELLRKIIPHFEDGLEINWESLTVEAAATISNCCGSLRFNNLTNLSQEAAEALSYSEGSLSFPSLKTLSDETAEALAGYQGETLNFPSLEMLSDQAAEALAKYEGDLCLEGLKNLSDHASRALENSKGLVYFGGVESD